MVHLAGATSSSNRLDDAVDDDVVQTASLITLARAAGAPFVYASRLSVAGGKKGLIAEVDPRTVLFGGSNIKGADVDVDKELATLQAEVTFLRASASHADHEARRRQSVQAGLVERGGPSNGVSFERAVDVARAKDEGKLLSAALVERAAGWRFPTASTWALRGFTRALGELVAARAADSVAVTLLRLPALLASVDDDDDDGHALGRLIDRVHEGALRLPFAARARVEALPLDLVADAVVAVVLSAMALKDSGPSLAVVQVATADKGQLSTTRLLDLLDLHLRDASDRPALTRVLSVDDATSLPPGLEQATDLAARVASSLVGLVGDRVGDRLGARASALGTEVEGTLRGLARASGRDLALCQAPPFFGDDVRFAQRGLRMLCNRASVPVVDVAGIDWRAHLMERHFPALDARRQKRLQAKTQQPIAPFDSLAHLLIEAAARHRSKPALSLFLAPGHELEDGSDVVDVSYAELLERASAAALRLQQAGVLPGDRVVIAGANHPGWGIVAFGVLLLRATLVPLDPNIAVDGAANVLKKARPRLIVCDKAVRARLTELLPNDDDRPVLDLHLTAVSGPGLDLSQHQLPSSSELASILFTSGTTGDPKGVMLSHGNFCALLGSLLAVFPVTGGDRMLSVLPLHHTFEFSCGLLMPLAAGARVYTPDAVVGERVLYAMKTAKITAIVGVPALWQLLERRIQKQSEDRGALASSVFQSLLSINKKLGTRFGLSAGKLLLKPVHDQFGGHLRVLISGGSALPPAVHELFQGLGLPLAEGYGLTESAPVLTVAAGKMGLPAGTVGQAIPGVELQLKDVDDKGVGELWARADNVMQGYFENDEATAAVLTADGWLKTGDLGTIDDHGTVKIVGRSKDVVVTASGENIYLDDVEKKLEPKTEAERHGVFELTLLGIPDPKGGERLALVLVASEKSASVDVVTADPELQQKARQAVQQRILKLPAWQRPAVVEVHDGPLPRTASRKVKRREVRAFLESLLKRRAIEAEAAGTAGGDNVVILSPVRLAIARTAGVEPSKVTSSTSLPADLGFDSLMWVELQSQLEPLAGFKLDPEVLVTKETVAEIELFIREAPTSGKTVAPVVVDVDAAASLPAPLREALELVVKAPSRRAARSALSLMQENLFSQGFKTTIEGRAFIPANRNVIVVANHSSHLDTGLVKYALGAYAQELRPLAAKDYFFEGNPLKVAFVENLTNLVPIDRETGSGLAFEQARAVVDAGHIVLIYPEGTRREDGTMGTFKPLVAKLALATGVDVLPLYLTGCFDAFPRGASFPKFGRPLKASIGPALSTSDLHRLTAHLAPVQAARAAVDVIRAAVVALRDGKALDLSRATSLETLAQATRVLSSSVASA
ncbi:MAG: AMP-binding protein [Deltaproteobacteria bacterium]|nr:AMP-binding protein [Deltaproteobacteria bacterium]